MAEKFWRWLIFSVVMALVPLCVSALIQTTHGVTVQLSSLVAHGELLLITAALCARSAGDLFGSGDKFNIPKIIAGGASLILLLISAIYFSDVASSYQSKSTLNLDVVCNTSLIVYVSGFLAGLGCILLSKA